MGLDQWAARSFHRTYGMRRSCRTFMRVGCGVLMWSSFGRMHGVSDLPGDPPPHLLAFHHPQDVGKGIAHTQLC